ncbi:hypothetical protein R6Q59_023178, partial [Mikania micrantha]
NIHFFGFDGQQKVTRSYGVVISLRGVGTHPATKSYSEGYLIIGFGRSVLFVFLERVKANFKKLYEASTENDIPFANDNDDLFED